MRDGRLQGCVFIAPDHRLVSRSWLAGLFAEDMISANARRSLLTLIESNLKDLDEGEIEFIHIHRDIAVIKKTA